jgi:hypothetical protein
MMTLTIPPDQTGHGTDTPTLSDTGSNPSRPVHATTTNEEFCLWSATVRDHGEYCEVVSLLLKPGRLDKKTGCTTEWQEDHETLEMALRRHFPPRHDDEQGFSDFVKRLQGGQSVLGVFGCDRKTAVSDFEKRSVRFEEESQRKHLTTAIGLENAIYGRLTFWAPERPLLNSVIGTAGRSKFGDVFALRPRLRTDVRSETQEHDTVKAIGPASSTSTDPDARDDSRYSVHDVMKLGSDKHECHLSIILRKREFRKPDTLRSTLLALVESVSAEIRLTASGFIEAVKEGHAISVDLRSKASEIRPLLAEEHEKDAKLYAERLENAKLHGEASLPEIHQPLFAHITCSYDTDEDADGDADPPTRSSLDSDATLDTGSKSLSKVRRLWRGITFRKD